MSVWRSVSGVLLNCCPPYLCIYVHMHISMKVCIHVGTCTRRPGIDIGCLPQSLSTLIFETIFLLNLELTNLTKITGQHPQGSSCLYCPGARIAYHAWILHMSPRAQVLICILQQLSPLPSETLMWFYTSIVSSSFTRDNYSMILCCRQNDKSFKEAWEKEDSAKV